MNNDSEVTAVDKNSHGKEGLLRINEILGPNGLLPMSKSTWYAGIKDGRYPKQVKLGPRISAWRKSDIDALIKNGAV